MLNKIWKDIKRIKYVDWHWLLIWVAIYITFLSLDIFFPNFVGANAIKYIGLFLCVVYAYQKFRTDALLILALLFTFLADTFLVWTDLYIPGVFCFCFAQFFHITRFTRTRPASLIGFFFIVLAIFVFGVTQGIDPLFTVAAIYALTLITNVVLSLIWYRQDKNNFAARCAFYGFILFLLCDLCVASQYLALGQNLPSIILPTVSFLVWFFYYPSQVFIANSSNTASSHKKALH